MNIEKRDILAPANAISVVGLALSVHGATHLNEVSGVIEFGLGRVLDLIDGPVARRTHASRTGALIDATADKAAVAAGLVGALYFEAVPTPVIGAIAAFNVANAAANIYTQKQGHEPETSKAGKRYMFGYNASFGALALGSAMEQNPALIATGWVLFALTTPVAIKATTDYTKQAVFARNHPHTRDTSKKR